MKSLLLALAVPLAASAFASQDIISTYAGGGPNNVPATAANVFPANTALDSSGNLYIVTQSPRDSQYQQSRVFEVNSSGTLTVVAGNGLAGFAGDGGPAVDAELHTPSAIAVDSSGNIYIDDYFNCAIRKVTKSTGVITTIAGIGPESCGYTGDGGPATSAELNYPIGVAVDSSGNLYIADTLNQRIRKITASTGDISTIAGDGTKGFSGDGGPATSAELSNPTSVALDSAGNVYIADDANFRIRKIAASTGKISTIAGDGTEGYSGDGGEATNAEISGVSGIAVDSSGRVFIGDSGNCVVREVKLTGIISTVAGTPRTCGYSGDGGPATSAQLNTIYGLAVNNSDVLYIADSLNNRVRKAAVGGDITTVAGNGSPGYTAGTTATEASLFLPQSATPDGSGNVYIADTYNCVLRKVNASGDITTIAGTPSTSSFTSNCGYSGDGVPASSAELNYPRKVITGPSGDLYIADEGNCVIRKITLSTGDISAVAGTPGTCGDAGDGGPATSAQLQDPEGMAFDSSGNLYIADTGNCLIRKVTASTGDISTILGNPSAFPLCGDNNPTLLYPEDVAVDSSGNLYIADTYHQHVLVLRVTFPPGLFVFAGECTNPNSTLGDGGPAYNACLNFPSGLATDVAGDILIADSNNNRIRWVSGGTGIIYTLAGGATPYAGYSGDGGSAKKAQLDFPEGVGVGPAGNIFIGDTYNFRIREVTAIANLNSSAYALTFPSRKVGTSGTQHVTLTGVGPLDIESISITGTDGDFTETNNCPSTLPSGSSCTVNVTFKPSSSGSKTGTVTVKTNGFFNPTVTLKLSGTGS